MSPTCDGSGNGEGKVFVGARMSRSEGQQRRSRPRSAARRTETSATATATDFAGNTSEFSPYEQIGGSETVALTSLRGLRLRHAQGRAARSTS